MNAANRTAPVVLAPCRKLTGKRGGRVALLHSFPISWSRLQPWPSTSEEMSISTLVTEPFINSTQGNQGQSRRKKTTHQLQDTNIEIKCKPYSVPQLCIHTPPTTQGFWCLREQITPTPKCLGGFTQRATSSVNSSNGTEQR